MPPCVHVLITRLCRSIILKLLSNKFLFAYSIPKKIEVDQPKQKLTTNSFLIYMFCTNYKHDIVSDLICRNGRTISGLQLAQTRKSTKNWSSNVGLIGEIMDMSRIHLALLLLDETWSVKYQNFSKMQNCGRQNL